MRIQGLLLILGFALSFTGIVECSSIEDVISDDEKCRMLQAAGMAALPVWAENRDVKLSLFVDIELLERKGWDLDNRSNLEEHFCRMAVAKTKRSLAEAFGFQEKTFRREYREMKRMLKQKFKGPVVFYNGATTFLQFMFFVHSMGLNASNPRPEISYDQAMDFLDEIEAEHGDTYLYDMFVFASAGYHFVETSVEKTVLARAISEAQSSREFADMTGLQRSLLDIIVHLVVYIENENPHLLNYMSVTAEYVKVANQIGFYSIEQ